jgi:O-antigen/teichoic acid export membrane protein
MRIGQNSAINFASEVLVSIFGFAATVYLARVLGDEVLGQYFLVIATVIWLQVLVGSGVQVPLKKFLSEVGDGEELFTAGLLLQLGLFGVVSLVLFLGRDYVTSYLDGVSALLLVAVLFATMVFAFVQNALDGLHLVHVSSLLKPLDRLARSTLQILAAVAGLATAGLLYGYIAAALVATAVGLYYVSTGVTVPGRSSFVKLASFARYSWLTSIGARAFASMDTVVLGLFVANGLIGVYEIAWNLASILAIFGVSASRAVFPKMSELASEGDHSEGGHLLTEAVRFTGLFLIPGLVGGALIGDRVLQVYGSDFVKGYQILLVLIAARTVYAYEAQFVSALNAINRPDLGFKIEGVFLVVNLVLNLVLVYEFGWYGAAVATFVSALVALVIGYAVVTRVIDFTLPLAEIARQASAALVMGVVVLIGETVLPGGMLVTVLLVLLGGGTYVVVLLALSPKLRSTVRANVPTVAR